MARHRIANPHELQALNAVVRATTLLQEADAAHRLACERAMASGFSLRQVAALAGLSASSLSRRQRDKTLSAPCNEEPRG